MSLLPFGRNNLHQSNLPVKTSSASQLVVGKHRSAQSQSGPPLTLSQALTITAGMAGLVGLFSGVLVRFSLANSSNARFLSPLQTFPELADWSSEPASEPVSSNASSADTANINVASPEEESALDLWQSPAELEWDEDTRDFDTFSSESFTDAQTTTELLLEDSEAAVDPFVETQGLPSDLRIEESVRNFDTFADRTEGQRQSESVDPLKTLSRGPLLRKPAAENSADAREYDWSESGVEESYGSTSFFEATPQGSIRNDETHSTVYDDELDSYRSYEDEDYYEREGW